MKTIAEQWTDFRRLVIPKDASPIQVNEMRRAFYAGADSLYVTIMVGLDPESEPTESDLERMASLHEELQQFARDVADGKA